MTLVLEHPEAVRLAEQLAKRTGETIDDAVLNALRERLERVPAGASDVEGLVDELLAIADECATLPVLDPRSPDDMLYDERGLPR